MPKTIFWSWQSDRPGRTNRHFLRDVVTRSIDLAGEGMSVAERPEIDQDVLGTAGIVSIPETILAKIDEAAVFVADLTPVATTAAGKPVANPNVLIELGYAKKALGPERIILIWNGAWGGCRPEDLPFDLRHRRAPFRYDLTEGMTGSERRAIGARLVPDLAAAIGASLARVPAAPAPLVARIEARADDPSVWFPAGQDLMVVSGWSSGPEMIAIPDSARSYLRIAPTAWGPVPLTGVDDGRQELMPLGDLMGMSWGRTRSGVIAYETEERKNGRSTVRNAAQWFASNGEIWGIDGRVTYGIDERRAGLAVDYVLQCWRRFLLRAGRTMADRGAIGPFAVEAGVTGFEDLYWPPDRYGSAAVPAIESRLVTQHTLGSLDTSVVDGFVRKAADEMRNAFGLQPFDEDRLAAILRDSRAQA